MAALKILSYPHPALRQIAAPITVFDEAFREQVTALFELNRLHRGVGLAAPQVGLSLRFFVMDASEEGNQPLCFANPVIVEKEGTAIFEEGCLSFPGVYAKVTRARKVTVQYQDEYGQPQTLTTDGLAAECIQHETEHLNGILLIDHLSKLKRSLFLKKMEKYQRATS